MITFFCVGLAKQSQEIEAKGYKRQSLALSIDATKTSYANESPIDFGYPLESWGFIDGLTLSTSMEGPVVAVSPLLIPMFAKVGVPFIFAPGDVTLNLKSFDAIINRRQIPIHIAS